METEVLELRKSKVPLVEWKSKSNDRKARKQFMLLVL